MYPTDMKVAKLHRLALNIQKFFNDKTFEAAENISTQFKNQEFKSN